MIDFDPTGHCVYLLFHDDKVLYVGKSDNVLGRLGTHLSSWAKGKVTRVRVLHCETRDEQAYLERKLIEQHRPWHNRAMNPDWNVEPVPYTADCADCGSKPGFHAANCPTWLRMVAAVCALNYEEVAS